jgi:hypothetical protein
MLTKMQQGMPANEGALVALRRPMVVQAVTRKR